MRLFFGLHLSTASRALLAGRLIELRRLAPEVAWVPPENLHLTLAFLGEVDDALLPDLCSAAEQACQGIGRLTLTYNRTPGAFTNWHDPRVIWLGVESDLQLLLSLHQSLQRELSPLGFAADQRWHPHVTLGRVKRRLSAAAEEGIRQSVWSLPAERFTEMTLFQSVLRPGGAIYKRLYTFSLGGSESMRNQE